MNTAVLFHGTAASFKLEEFELVCFQNATINLRYRTTWERSEKDFGVLFLPMSFSFYTEGLLMFMTKQSIDTFYSIATNVFIAIK